MVTHCLCGLMQDLAESERPTAIVASCFDVTHLKETELQLLGMKQALQQCAFLLSFCLALF